MKTWPPGMQKQLLIHEITRQMKDTKIQNHILSGFQRCIK